jgi:hypothetical protein
MTYNGLHQRLWFRGYMDPTLARDVDQSALQALVPLDRSQRVFKPLGSAFDNRIQMRLADGALRNTSVTDMVNWNARNFYRGPGVWNTDISIFKNIYITERIRTRITADFFNAFNHPVDMDPNLQTGLQDLSRSRTGTDPRIIQFSLRVDF